MGEIKQGALEPGLTADDLFERYGFAIRRGREAWVCAFHFAGPDVVAQGETAEAAMANFRLTVAALNGEDSKE